MRLRTRVFLAIFAITAMGLTGLLNWMLDDLRTRYLESVEENLVETSNLLATLIESHQTDTPLHVPAALGEALSRLRTRPIDVQIYDLRKLGVDLRVYVTNARGIVVYDSRPGGGDVGMDYSKWRNVSRTLAGQYGARTTRANPKDEESSTLHVSAPVRHDGRIIGVISVAKPTQSINLFLRMARPKIILAGLFAGFVAVLSGWLLSLWLIQPILRLAKHARAVRDGKPSPLPHLGQSEVRELGQAFEEMRIALEGKQYVEQYVHNLTHEFKSPLTAIQAGAEILIEDPPLEVRQKFSGHILAESKRLHDTVEHLLELASLEARNTLVSSVPIDLNELTQELQSSLEGILQAHTLSIDIHGSAIALGERFLVERALRNLVVNAIAFSPDGATIDVQLSRTNSVARVEVLDRGPGVPEYAQGRVFERFFSLAPPSGGRKSSGLGLPFVAAVARLHGTSTGLEARPGGGTVAWLELPSAPH